MPRMLYGKTTYEMSEFPRDSIRQGPSQQRSCLAARWTARSDLRGCLGGVIGGLNRATPFVAFHHLQNSIGSGSSTPRRFLLRFTMRGRMLFRHEYAPSHVAMLDQRHVPRQFG